MSERSRAFALVHVRDLVVDTRSLSAEHVGAYSLLLFAIWNGDGTLPQDEHALARIARVPVSRWRQLWCDLRPFFVEDGGKVSTIHVKKWRSKASVLGRSRLSATIRSEIFARDRARCQYCGSIVGPFHVDHVTPVAKGGSDEPSNLVLACQPCNLSKGAKTLEEWRQ